MPQPVMAMERICIRARPAVSSLRMTRQRASQRAMSNTATSSAPAAATAVAPVPDQEMESSSFATGKGSAQEAAKFDPLKRAKSREKELPPSRFKYRPPRYYRGPLHPHQPPPKSDPASREYVPGPFSFPRLQQTYTATTSHDLMTIYYDHVPPGTPKLPTPPRLRYWDDSSPYMKNRPPRAPRGKPNQSIGLLRHPINWWNLPHLERITVASLVPDGVQSYPHLQAAGMVVQAITGVRAKVHLARKGTGVTAYRRVVYTQKRNKPIAVSAELTGENMWHFLSTLKDIVLPKIKEWKGIPGRSGDDNGNMQIGLNPEVVGEWPELLVNYDAYPEGMIPGVSITLHTSARDDRDMRLFIATLGIPFKGTQPTRT